MKIHSLSLFLGLTLTTPLLAMGAKAATIDFNNLQLITVKPIASNYFLSFNGEPADNQGQTAFLNPDPTAPDFGHIEISKNSPPGSIAPYYATGRQSSPEMSGSTRSATLEGVTGLTNFFNYLSSNSIDPSRIGFGYGQKSDRTFTETWNLGDDLLGQDWLASPDSPIEERIYKANPEAVESFLLLDDVRFITFDYSPLYGIFDKGDTQAIDDDVEIFFTESGKAHKVNGLDPLIGSLADAFLQDVKLYGGRVQVLVEDSGVENPVPIFDPNTGYVIVNFPLPLTLKVVSRVPEPSVTLGLFLLGALGLWHSQGRKQ